jgi:hypothetical protein
MEVGSGQVPGRREVCSKWSGRDRDDGQRNPIIKDGKNSKVESFGQKFGRTGRRTPAAGVASAEAVQS